MYNRFLVRSITGPMQYTKTVMKKCLVAQGNFEIVTVNEDLFDQCLDILCGDFLRGEAICSTLGVINSPRGVEDMKKLSLVALEEGISICAVEKFTGVVAAVMCNKFQFKPQPNEKPFFANMIENEFKDDQAKGFLHYMLTVESQVDLYSIYNATCTMELMLLGTREGYRSRGLALAVTRASLALAEAQARGDYQSPKYSDRIQAVTAVYTASHSQKVGVKLGMDVVVRGPNRLEYQGKIYVPEKEHHATYALCGKQIVVKK